MAKHKSRGAIGNTPMENTTMRENQLKNKKTAKQLVFLHFWWFGAEHLWIQKLITCFRQVLIQIVNFRTKSEISLEKH